MKKILFVFVSFGIFQLWGAEIQLEKSIINGDYIEIEKLRASKNVIVVDKKDIEDKGYESVEAVLNDIPSINVGTSGYGEIDIRGQGADQATKNIQVLVDGAPITTLISHPFQTNYNIIPVEQIEKIEIIPGGGSVLYGSGVSGGVVNITTNLKEMGKVKNKLGYEFQEKKEKYYLNTGFGFGEKVSLQFNYSKGDEDLYFVDTYRNNEYFSGGLNYRISNRQNLSIKYSKFEEEGQFIKNITKSNLEEYGRDYIPRDVTITTGIDEMGQKIRIKKPGYLSADREEESTKASYSIAIGDKISLLTDVFKSEGYFINNNDDNKRLNQSTKGAKLKLDYKYFDNDSVLLGLDYYSQDADLVYNTYKYKKDENGEYIKNSLGQKMYEAYPLVFDYEKSVKAVFAMNKIIWKDFEFTQGIRRDITEWKFFKNASDGDGTDKSDRKNNAYELSTTWNYSDTGNIYARYEKGFTGPDGLQVSDRVYIDGEKVYKNTEAEDEEFDIYEIGIRDYIMGSAINISAFMTNTDNQMNRLYIWNEDGRLEYRTLNLLKTKRYGVEASASQIFGRFTFEESYAYLMGRSGYNQKGQEFLESDKKIDWENSGLKKVPRDTVVLKMNYKIIDGLDFGYTYKYTGKYNNYWKESEREEDTLVDNNQVSDINLRYTSNFGMVLYGGINNIFNEEYYSYVGDSFATVIPCEGRVYYLGFSYSL